MAWSDTPCDIEARTKQGLRSGKPRTARAHVRIIRLKWSEFYGVPWPKGMLACHHCDEPRCSNPQHIFVGTFKDNSKDAYMKRGRWGSIHGSGEEHRFSKLTWSDVRDIRHRASQGERQAGIARSYGLDQSTVSQIVNHVRWKGDPNGVVL